MPLFGGKSNEKKTPPDSGKSGYPTSSYPTASYPSSSYPSQPANAPVGAVGGQPYAAGASGYPVAPPPQYNTQYGMQQNVPPQYGMPPPAYTQNYQPPPPPGSMTVVMQNGFDAGARFTHGSTSLPPPPPGVMPNAAQAAAVQGHNVVVTQKKGNYFTGGSDGGYTIW